MTFDNYHFKSEYLATTLANNLTLGELELLEFNELKDDDCGWTYVATKVPSQNAWTVDVYDEDGIRLGAL